MSEPVDKTTPEEDVIAEKCERFIGQLQEHHDVNIRIFVTTKASRRSHGNSFASGDFYSLYGFIHDWFVMQDERQRIHTRKEENADTSDID